MLLTLFLISLSTAPALHSHKSQCEVKFLGVLHHLREVSIDRQQLGIVLDMPSMLMDMQLAKVGTKLLLLLEADVNKVLIAEDNDASLCSEEGEFVLLLRVQRAKLQAMNFGTDRRGDFLERGSRGI